MYLRCHVLDPQQHRLPQPYLFFLYILILSRLMSIPNGTSDNKNKLPTRVKRMNI